MLRMDINKKIEESNKQKTSIATLQEQYDLMMSKVSELANKE